MVLEVRLFVLTLVLVVRLLKVLVLLEVRLAVVSRLRFVVMVLRLASVASTIASTIVGFVVVVTTDVLILRLVVRTRGLTLVTQRSCWYRERRFLFNTCRSCVVDRSR